MVHEKSITRWAKEGVVYSVVYDSEYKSSQFYLNSHRILINTN